MPIWLEVKRSLYDFTWLRARRQERRAAWRYAARFLLVVVIVYSLPLVFTRPRVMRQLQAAVSAKLPNFQATLQNGFLTVAGVAQPYRWSGPEENFVAVVATDPAATTTLAALLSGAESGVLIAHNRVEWRNTRSGREQIQYWKDLPGLRDGVLTKGQIEQTLVALQRPRVLVPLSVAAIAIFYLVLFSSKLVSLGVVCVIAAVVARLGRRDWRLGELFTVGLYALTLPTLVSMALFWLRVRPGSLPFLMLLAFMLALVLTKDQTSGAAGTAAPSSTPPSAPASSAPQGGPPAPPVGQ